MNNNRFKKTLEDEIDILEIFFFLWKRKIIIFCITSIFAVGSIIYSLSLPNLYKSYAVLASASGSGGNLSRLGSQYAGIANLAGVNISSNTEVDKVAMGVETLTSLNFFEEVVRNNDEFYYKLLAAKGWNSDTNTLIIDQDIYDQKNNKWVSEEKYSINGMPSLQFAHRKFKENLLITENDITGFVTISYIHYSPYVAKEILEIIILEINERTRLEEISIANESIKYLKNETQQAQVSSINAVISNLIEKQIERITFAKASPQFLFKELSKPYAPEKKEKPNRSVIVILSTILGFLIGSAWALFNQYLKTSENKKLLSRYKNS